MKYTIDVEINKPLDKVIELFDNPANLDKWMPGLVSFEPISGTPGQPGAKSKLKFENGKNKFELIETILVRDLPKEFTGTYEAKGMKQHAKNSFIPVSSDKTRFVSEQEYTFSGFMKVIGFLVPGMIKKQSIKCLDDFKVFAENTK